MPKLPKLIRVTRRGNRFEIEIDGVDFPWFTAQGMTRLTISRDNAPTLEVGLMAERIEVIDDINSEVIHAADPDS